MFEGTTMFELGYWLASMMLVAWLSFRLATKLKSHNPSHGAIPKINSVMGAKIFNMIALNYVMVTVGCILMYFNSDQNLVNEIKKILDSWWLIEIFVLFNLITSYTLWDARKRIIVNV